MMNDSMPQDMTVFHSLSSLHSETASSSSFLPLFSPSYTFLFSSDPLLCVGTVLVSLLAG